MSNGFSMPLDPAGNKQREDLLEKFHSLEQQLMRLQRIDLIKKRLADPETKKLHDELLVDYNITELEMMEILLQSGYGLNEDPNHSQIFFDNLNKYCAIKYGKIGKLIYE